MGNSNQSQSGKSSADDLENNPKHDTRQMNYEHRLLLRGEKFSMDEERPPLSKRDLEYQKHDLIKNFLFANQNYVYQWDSDDKTKREQFLRRTFQTSLIGGTCLQASNTISYKFQYKPKQKMTSVDLIFILTSNLIVCGYVTWDGLKLYNSIDNYLYNKFLHQPKRLTNKPQ